MCPQECRHGSNPLLGHLQEVGQGPDSDTVQTEIPYFTKKRFPNWWPITEALKQYLRNTRKNTKRKKEERIAKRKAAKEAGNSSNGDDTTGSGTTSNRNGNSSVGADSDGDNEMCSNTDNE
ncbi:hypothetical protein VKT23_015092 [Stygiomarasmius scandens]|uniref:Uncharacterized protein n=1 Tax=Marasmiellus scandens TaxID=2682957 RepID=A0ABR1J0Z1_9AGAR